MTSDHPRPPRPVVWLLEQVSSTHAAGAAVGDVLEELQQRTTAGRRPPFTTLWLTLQVLAAVGGAVRVAAPRGARSLGHTVRDAARALRRAPAHALFIVVVLAVAIAAATVTFSVVDAVVLKSMPFERADRIVLVNGRTPRGVRLLHSDEFWAMHDHVPGFESLAPFTRTSNGTVTVDGADQYLGVTECTTELFHLLRLESPAIGRAWTSEEERRGDGVAVIGFRFWQRQFGGDPSAVGRSLRIDKKVYQIVGVLPASADRLQTIGWATDVWMPRVPPRPGQPYADSVIFALGRLADGVSTEVAAAQIGSAMAPLVAANPTAFAGWQPNVAPWQETMVGSVRGWMLLALGAVALVVLIGCVNAANVMLTRSVERARELAVRASLGASRRQIAMSLLVESLMLSTAACTCALVFAKWGNGMAKAALPPYIFRADSIGLNGRVFAAAVLAAIVTGLLFGMIPAWLASRVSISTLLKDSGAPATSGRRGWRSALLVAQIAGISVLLVVSTLFVTSFIRVMTLDLGIERSSLLALTSGSPFKAPVDDVARRLKQVPGIVDVAVATYTSLPVMSPAFGGAYPTTKLVASDPGQGAAPVETLVYRVTRNYFDVTGMAFRRGSVWSASPPLDSEPVVLDERAARRLFGERNPLGLEVRSDFLDDALYFKERKVVFTVVGVVPFVYARGPEGEATPAMYLPIVPKPSRTFAGLFARTAGPAEALVPAVETALKPVAPGGPYVHAMDEAVRRLAASRRFTAGLMSLFALFALLIGAAGVYGVMASIVAQRTREIGVRMALGASAGDIRRGVLGQAALLLAFGLTAGLPIGWWISRGFASLFFRAAPTDLSIYVIVAILLAVVAVFAAFVPARRASRVDPIVSLRCS